MYSLKESGEVYGGCSRTYMRTHMGARAVLAGGDLYIPPHKRCCSVPRVSISKPHIYLYAHPGKRSGREHKRRCCKMP